MLLLLLFYRSDGSVISILSPDEQIVKLVSPQEFKKASPVLKSQYIADCSNSNDTIGKRTFECNLDHVNSML